MADVLAVGTTEAELLAHLTNITEIAEMDPAAVHTLKQAVVGLRTQLAGGGERATATRTAEAECGSHTAHRWKAHLRWGYTHKLLKIMGVPDAKKTKNGYIHTYMLHHYTALLYART